MQEIEARLAQYLQKGASVEAEVLTAFADMLPQDVKDNLPAELKDVLLRGSLDKQVPPTPPTYQEAEAVPIAVVAKTQTGRLLRSVCKPTRCMRGQAVRSCLLRSVWSSHTLQVLLLPPETMQFWRAVCMYWG